VPPHYEIQIICGGQSVNHIPPLFEIKIVKSEKPFKLIHTSLTTYFETLRNKLLWGVDGRRNKINREEK